MSEPRRPDPRLPNPGRRSGRSVGISRAATAVALLTVATAALVAGAWIVAGLGAALIVGGCFVGVVGFFLAWEA